MPVVDEGRERFLELGGHVGGLVESGELLVQLHVVAPHRGVHPAGPGFGVGSAGDVEGAAGGHGDLLLGQRADLNKVPGVLVKPPQAVARALEILKVGGEEGVVAVIQPHLECVLRGAGINSHCDRSKHTKEKSAQKLLHTSS